MNLLARQARAKARVKTMNLRRTGVPCTASKWGYMSEWKSHGFTPGQVQGIKKTARREPAIVTAFRNADGSMDQFSDDHVYLGAA